MKRVGLLLAAVGAAVVLASGIALAADVVCTGGVCEGTDRSDVLYGTAGRDVMWAKGGGDSLLAYKGDDQLRGQRGNDRLYGEFGDDILRGGRGTNELYGGPGTDELYDTFDGNGELFRPPDELYGGRDRDFLDSFDGYHDEVFCGGGYDQAIGDEGDSYHDCEVIGIPGGF